MSNILDRVKEALRRHEGLRLQIYEDTKGIPTIGYGINLSIGISKNEAELLLHSRVFDSLISSRDILDDFESHPDHVKKAVCMLVYNMGKRTFKGFKKTIALINGNEYLAAGKELLDSNWAVDVKFFRATDVAALLAGMTPQDFLDQDPWPKARLDQL